ncbi:MAG: excinuclease ABC subunit UvrB [Parcubacteria group bacterium]|nr:excinuclease ABC subunit UvrB [Parcubacteria group bacterium]
MEFRLVSSYKPTGDQPEAIRQLTKNLKIGAKHQTLLGVTGSGKTFTMSNVIAQTQRPTLVISPNKTLAAQLYQEFKEFFPNSGVHYFVSYYDYYQPEAYIPQTDTYIEKDAKINEVLDRLRHEAVQDVLSRRDVIVVASISCIYSIGSPEEYRRVSLGLKEGQKMTRKELLSALTSLQYQRSDADLKPGTFRVRGEIIDLYLVTGKEILRFEMAGSTIGKITKSYADHEEPGTALSSCTVYPGKFWVAEEERLKVAMANIRLELQERLQELKKQGKLLEAERLEQRTNYDLEMIAESGYCHGIENYSRHLEFRKQGDPPFTLLDYFPASPARLAEAPAKRAGGPKDLLVFLDESHLTLPQLQAMSAQDRMRKESLVEHGFRLPSAIDNRPLRKEEFFARAPQVTYVSATPGAFEKQMSGPFVAEQLIRPTLLLEPVVEIRTTKNQLSDLLKEIQGLAQKKQRTLVVTLTKRLAEDIADHLAKAGVSVQWMHSEVKTLDRPHILESFRRGTYDVLVGINLLREGLDLPEVALVAILDADKEGFLRNETTLIQTMGRAARHQEGRAILYADTITGSMQRALKEISRRRKIQEEYNKEHGGVPQAIVKEIRKWELGTKEKATLAEFAAVQDVQVLQQEMRTAASSLDFERAAEIRDLIKKVKGDTNTGYGKYNIGPEGVAAKRQKEKDKPGKKSRG